MRIIEHGNMSLYHETEHVCKSCDCKFNFTLADVSTKLEYSAENDKFVSCNYIVCPECKTIYILNQEKEVEKDEETAGGSSDAPDIVIGDEDEG